MYRFNPSDEQKRVIDLMIEGKNEFEFEFTIWDDNEETAREIYAETVWCYKTNSEVTHETSVITLAKDFAKRNNLEFLHIN